MIEVEAQRLGSKLRPIIHLYRPRQAATRLVVGHPALFGDTRLEAILPEDGPTPSRFTTWNTPPAAGSFFRLRDRGMVVRRSCVPAGAGPNQAATVELLG